MKIQYVDPRNMRPATRELLGRIIEVVEDYGSQGYRLTLRQLYYQLVAAGILPNEQRQYARLSNILANARMCGMVDWDSIEDRLRVPQRPAQWDSVADILESAANQYRRDRHAGQTNYPEVWVEKDALSGVLLPVTEEYHVSLLVNRGYSSVSAMHAAALRFQNCGRAPHILYLGDHDPSGLDMVRDISDRLAGFGVCVDVRPIALTKDQIERYDPPPNPTKVTDSRAEKYIAEHGRTSWELDALPPSVLHELVRGGLESLLDMDKYNACVAEERDDIRAIRDYAASL